jgi:hypothetical protein
MFPSDPSCMEPNYVSLLSNIICKVVTKVLYYTREGGAGVRAFGQCVAKPIEAAQPLGAFYGLRPKALREP